MTIKSILPSLYREDPSFYERMRIHELTSKYRLPELMFKAFEVLAEMKMTQHAAWQQELAGNVVEVPLRHMVDRIRANMILQYPPGVPLVLSSEMVTKDSLPVLEFLEMLCEIGAHYPRASRAISTASIVRPMAATPSRCWC